MQTVSSRWKQLHATDLLPENHIKIEWSVTSPGLNDTFIPSSTDMVSWGDVSRLSESLTPPHYVTLEKNLWLLDGYQTLPSASQLQIQNGQFISDEFGDAEGYYTNNPKVFFTWDTVCTNIVPGITVQWSETYNECPKTFKVSVYNGSTLVNERTFENNTERFFVYEVDIYNFNRVEIEVIQWGLPYRRAKMERLYVGIITLYDKGDLMSYSHTNFIDLLSGDVPRNSITFELDNIDDVWNPFIEEGKSKYLSRQQTLHVSYGMDVDGTTEWINGGTFFMSEWSTKQNGLTAEFTASDLCQFLQETKYTGRTSGTAYQMCVSAMECADLPDEASYQFTQSLMIQPVDITADDTEYTVMDILQLCANLCGCIIYQDREGCLKIELSKSGLMNYTISKDIEYSNPEISLSKPLKSVNVNDGLATYDVGTTGEIQTMSNPLVTDSVWAISLASWVANTLKNRTTLSGDFRGDPRLEAGDVVTVETKVGSAKTYITQVDYDFSGSFKASFEGRVLE